MKSLILTLTTFSCLVAHSQESPVFSPKTCEDLTESNLTDQFNAGILQRKMILREVDFHTLLHRAIWENSPEVIRFLLDLGIDVDSVDQHGMSPLAIAILTRNNYVIDLLLTRGANPNPPKWKEFGLLSLAVHMRDFATALRLIEKGADINENDYYGCGLLHHVINSLDSMHYDNQGRYIGEEMYNEWIQVVTAMIPKAALYGSEDSWCPALQALSKRPLLELMFKNGLDINAILCERTSHPTTLLIYALYEHDLETIKWLIEAGADVTLSVVQEYNGRKKEISPLTTAIAVGNVEIIQYLLQHGAR